VTGRRHNKTLERKKIQSGQAYKKGKKNFEAQTRSNYRSWRDMKKTLDTKEGREAGKGSSQEKSQAKGGITKGEEETGLD